MEELNKRGNYSLRAARQEDSRTIRQIIRQVQINPLSLDWRRFILAVDGSSRVIGCGQIKPHSDGSRELASIAVLPEWRGNGIAREIIDELLENQSGAIYLTCRNQLEPLYQKFGFRSLQVAEMPPYFRRLSRLVNGLGRLMRQPDRMLVMRRDKALSH